MAPWVKVPASPVWFPNFDGVHTHAFTTRRNSNATQQQQHQHQQSPRSHSSSKSDIPSQTIPSASRRPARTTPQSARGKKHHKGYFPPIRGKAAMNEVRDAQIRWMRDMNGLGDEQESRRSRSRSRNGSGSGSGSGRKTESQHRQETCSSSNNNNNNNEYSNSPSEAGAYDIQSSSSDEPRQGASRANVYFFDHPRIVLMPPPAPQRNGIRRIHTTDSNEDHDEYENNNDDSNSNENDANATANPSPPHHAPPLRAEISALRLYSRSLHAQLERAKRALEPEDADAHVGGEALTGDEYGKFDRLRRVYLEQGNTAECRPPMGMQAGIGEWR